MPTKVSKKVVGIIIRNRKSIMKDGVMTVRIFQHPYINRPIGWQWFDTYISASTSCDADIVPLGSLWAHHLIKYDDNAAHVYFFLADRNSLRPCSMALKECRLPYLLFGNNNKAQFRRPHLKLGPIQSSLASKTCPYLTWPGVYLNRTERTVPLPNRYRAT
jgi:hypothetical protein